MKNIYEEDMAIVLEAVQLLADAGEKGRLEIIAQRACRGIEQCESGDVMPPIAKDAEGLFSKYQVRDTNGESLDSGTFVLRPFNSDGTIRDVNAGEALNSYAQLVESDNAELHDSIMAWLDNPVDHKATKSLNIPSIRSSDDDN